MELSRAKIKYLLVILHRERDKKVVRSVDIAVYLGVARPSVHRMLRELMAAGMIRMEPRGAVELTDAGRAAAENCDRQYQRLFPYFHQVLGLSEYEAEQSLLAALSALPPVCLEAMGRHAAAD